MPCVDLKALLFTFMALSASADPPSLPAVVAGLALRPLAPFGPGACKMDIMLIFTGSQGAASCPHPSIVFLGRNVVLLCLHGVYERLQGPQVASARFSGTQKLARPHKKRIWQLQLKTLRRSWQSDLTLNARLHVFP